MTKSPLHTTETEGMSGRGSVIRMVLVGRVKTKPPIVKPFAKVILGRFPLLAHKLPNRAVHRRGGPVPTGA